MNNVFERHDYDAESSGQGAGNWTSAELHDMLAQVADKYADYEVDLDILVNRIKSTQAEIDYDTKHMLLSNLGYLIQNETASLYGNDVLFSGEKELVDDLKKVLNGAQNNAYEIDTLFAKVQKLIG